MKNLKLSLIALLSVFAINSCDKPGDDEPTPDKGDAVIEFREIARSVVETETTVSVKIGIASGTPIEYPITFDVQMAGDDMAGVTMVKSKDLTIEKGSVATLEINLALASADAERVYTFTLVPTGANGVSVVDATKSFVLTATPAVIPTPGVAEGEYTYSFRVSDPANPEEYISNLDIVKVDDTNYTVTGLGGFIGSGTTDGHDFIFPAIFDAEENTLTITGHGFHFSGEAPFPKSVINDDYIFAMNEAGTLGLGIYLLDYDFENMEPVTSNIVINLTPDADNMVRTPTSFESLFGWRVVNIADQIPVSAANEVWHGQVTSLDFVVE